MKKVSKASEYFSQINYKNAHFQAEKLDLLFKHVDPNNPNSAKPHVRVLGPESEATDLPPICSAEEHEGDVE